jgi:tight adherence protein B
VRADLIAGALAAAAVGLLAVALRGERRRTLLAAAGAVAIANGEVATGHLHARKGSAGRERWIGPLAVVSGAAIGWAIGGIGPAVVGGGAGALAPIASRRRRDAKRAQALQGQLADAVSAVAAGARAGLSIPQAVALAADQTPDPLGSSLRTVVDGTNLGSSLDDALERWTVAVPVPDVRLAAAVLRLHGRTGGALPPVLDGLARTLRERMASVREIRSLTAQARLSGAILGLLPIGFFAFLWVSSRQDMAAAVSSTIGRTAIAVGLGLQAVAYVWIRRLLRVEG